MNNVFPLHLGFMTSLPVLFGVCAADKSKAACSLLLWKPSVWNKQREWAKGNLRCNWALGLEENKEQMFVIELACQCPARVQKMSSLTAWSSVTKSSLRRESKALLSQDQSRKGFRHHGIQHSNFHPRPLRIQELGYSTGTHRADFWLLRNEFS